LFQIPLTLQNKEIYSFIRQSEKYAANQAAAAAEAAAALITAAAEGAIPVAEEASSLSIW